MDKVGLSRKYWVRYLVLLVMLFQGSVFADEGEASDSNGLTLARIFTDEDFETEEFGPARWLEDGSGYTTLEKPEGHTEDDDEENEEEEENEREITLDQLPAKAKAAILKLAGKSKVEEVEEVAMKLYEAEWIQGRSHTADAVRDSARLEHRLVVDLFRRAPARLGVRRDRGSVGSDRGDNGGFLRQIEGRRLADGAVFGLGQLCQRVELHDLANQCWMTRQRSSER